MPTTRVVPPGDVVFQARAFHAAVIAADDKALREVAQAWMKVRTDLIRQEREFLANIVKQHGYPIRMTPNQLYRDARFRSLIAQVEEQIDSFAKGVQGTVDEQRARAFTLAAEHADEYARLSGFSGMQQVAPVTDPAFLQAAVGRERTDAVRGLFDRFGRETGQRCRDIIVTGVGSARHPLAVARDLVKATDMPGWQAARISRTEMMTAYRSGSLDSWRRSTVIEGWVWMTAGDRRVCPVCRAMSGTSHPMSDDFASHPSCRCIPVPQTMSWSDIGDSVGADFSGIDESVIPIPDGEKAFAALSRAEQKAVLGPGRYELYANGTPLRSMVRTTDSAVWGPGRELIPLYEM